MTNAEQVAQEQDALDDPDALELDETQLEAIDACCNIGNRIVAITGPAGSGKTTIMRKVYSNLYDSKHDVVLCAPTGKAVKRITEATGIPAMTIHRLLEYPHPGELDEKTGKPMITTNPRKDKFNPIFAQVVLCDEYSMISDELHRNLLDALPKGGIIRMFGDANQLQPIEPSKRMQAEPSSFIKILDNHKFVSIKLDTIHRQANDSNIISNGVRIINGFMPRKENDFVIKFTEKPVETVVEFVLDNLADGIDYGSLNCQLITPTKIGWVGSEALNAALQVVLQPSSSHYQIVERHKWSKIDEQRFYVNDKVIFTVNNYGLDIFNGESGIIKSFTADNSIIVDFGDKEVTIPVSQEVEGNKGTYYINPQKDLDLAYVITTHKSQGSEYDRICYIMNRSRSYLLNRKNFYTAVSRAKKHVTIISDPKSIEMSLYKKGDK